MVPQEEQTAAAEASAVQNKTPFLQKLSCGTGNVINELFLLVNNSFSLVFFIKVAQLNGSQAGIIMLTSNVVNAVFCIIVGYCSDAFSVPLLARVLGRRKAWHLIGVVIMASFFPLMFTRCLACTDDSPWPKFAYYLVIMIFTNGVAFPTLNLGHLSIIAVVATMFTYASGILTYTMTWIVLGKDSRDNLSPDSWKDFMIVNSVLVAVGILFSVIFHAGTKEPTMEKQQGEAAGFFTKQGLLTVALAFMIGSDTEGEGVGVRKPSRKSSANIVRKLSSLLVPFDASLILNDDVDENPNDDHTTSPESRDVKEGVSKGEPENRTETAKNYQETAQGVLTSGTEGEATSGTKGEASSGTTRKTASGTHDESRKSSFYGKIVDACHVVESEVKRIRRTRRSWLKDPGLYRVCFLVTMSQMALSLGASYMPFYLTDYLLLKKESIAYFPLVLLVSGLCGTVSVKLLEKRLGGKSTFCLATAVLTGTAVWLYFISPSTSYLAYPAAVLVGMTTATMLVLYLTFLGVLTGEDKRTAGFVVSVAGFILRVTLGAVYMAIQIFYPTRGDDGSCPNCAGFARHVFALSLAVPALLSFLVVLFFQKSKPSGEATGQAKPLGSVDRPAFKGSSSHPVSLTSFQKLSGHSYHNHGLELQEEMKP